MTTPSIVLVDDEKPILKALKRELSDLAGEFSVELKTFTHPEDALLYINGNAEKVAVLISDQKMPGMKGCDFIGKAREINSRIVSILLTAYTDTEDIIKTVRSGIFSFILKPWNKDDLENEVRKAFMHHKREREALAKAEILEKEISGGGQVQERFLAPSLKKDRRLTYSVSYKPHLSCGGDYYDLIKISEDRYLVAIGDVAGHGIKAAFITFALKTILKEKAFAGMAAGNYSLDRLMSYINKRIFTVIKSIQPLFISFCLCLVDLGEKRLSLCNGGHMHPIILRGEKLIELDTTGTALGFRKNLEYSESRYILKDKDRIILYTDGLIEIDGGIDKLKEIFLFYRNNPYFTSVVSDEVNRNMAKGRGKDDKTLISLVLNI